MPVQVRVFVREGEARVWPPTQFVSSGKAAGGGGGAIAADSIEFINLTNDDIFVAFPVDVFVGATDHRQKIGKGTKGSGTPKQDGSGGEKKKGSRLQYQIFCAETNSMAIGNSAPEVIIE